jgi:hypothetical protein
VLLTYCSISLVYVAKNLNAIKLENASNLIESGVKDTNNEGLWIIF